MRARTIQFFFDYLSPYAYLAWTQVHALAARHEAVVEPVPTLLAALLNAYGHKGPAEIPPKRLYVLKDVIRTAHRLGVPIAAPPSHPFNPLLALRVSSLPMQEQTRKALIDKLFAATWAKGTGVTDPAIVATLASEVGLDGAAAIADAESDTGKARLKAQTARALSLGAFGVPSLVVGDELFWGFDSFAHLETYLRGEDPVSPTLIERLKSLQASATRK